MPWLLEGPLLAERPLCDGQRSFGGRCCLGRHNSDSEGNPGGESEGSKRMALQWGRAPGERAPAERARSSSAQESFL